MITDRQRERRKKYLGSSDSPAVCGVDPWRNAYDVYLSKVENLEETTSPEKEWGNLLEPVLIQWASQKLGVKIRRNVSKIFHDRIFADNADGVAMCPGGAIIEAKTSGVEHFADKEAWGEEGSDEVPEHVLVQCHHLMLVHKTTLAYVPTFLGGRGFAMFKIERNNALCDSIYERGVAFWTENVLPRIPPPDMMPTLETLMRMRREPGKAVPVPVELIEDLARARQAKKTAKAQEEAAKAAVLLAMGDAERGDGYYLVEKETPEITAWTESRKGLLEASGQLEVVESAIKEMTPIEFETIMTDLYVTAKLDKPKACISAKEVLRLAPDLFQQIGHMSKPSRRVLIGGCTDAED